MRMAERTSCDLPGNRMARGVALPARGRRRGIAHAVVTLVAFAVGLTFRLLAIRFKWEMPKFVYDRDLH